METLYTLIFHRKKGLNDLQGNRERQKSGQLVPDKDKIGAPKDIEIAIEDPDGQVFEKASLVFSVIEVIPRDGDPLHRNYVSKDGLPSTHPLPNYMIEDPKAVFEALVARSETHALPWEKSSHGSYPMKIFVKLHEEKRTKYHERLLLLVEYDFGTHFKTGSGFIISEETLGIQPLPWDAERLAGKCPTPRLATGAVDKIEDGRMEELLKKEILLDRSAMGLYLANLIVVGWAYRSEVVLKDRNRRAREKGREVGLSDTFSRNFANCDKGDPAAVMGWRHRAEYARGHHLIDAKGQDPKDQKTECDRRSRRRPCDWTRKVGGCEGVGEGPRLESSLL
ncbi:uncharacterized protein B0I36DRAFT_342238 [Microdochium trichocladiopsis]|uniref:Uncharacterized protein n=1 Tax=Microdochium trichocladiopsis TaxID=1682393 RepID=A0A9P8XRI8_9PEZI|nr:uncharacterized protein B0I36DRAFT_342238 [Microdochium trichocladiopsis]KAH7009393.1 hypothetical protein B0I36DRAFT_342238 [Microdochium trichocladiopsis]